MVFKKPFSQSLLAATVGWAALIEPAFGHLIKTTPRTTSNDYGKDSRTLLQQQKRYDFSTEVLSSVTDIRRSTDSAGSEVLYYSRTVATYVPLVPTTTLITLTSPGSPPTDAPSGTSVPSSPADTTFHNEDNVMTMTMDDNGNWICPTFNPEVPAVSQIFRSIFSGWPFVNAVQNTALPDCTVPIESMTAYANSTSWPCRPTSVPAWLHCQVSTNVFDGLPTGTSSGGPPIIVTGSNPPTIPATNSATPTIQTVTQTVTVGGNDASTTSPTTSPTDTSSITSPVTALTTTIILEDPPSQTWSRPTKPTSMSSVTDTSSNMSLTTTIILEDPPSRTGTHKPTSMSSHSNSTSSASSGSSDTTTADTTTTSDSSSIFTTTDFTTTVDTITSLSNSSSTTSMLLPWTNSTSSLSSTEVVTSLSNTTSLQSSTDDTTSSSVSTRLPWSITNTIAPWRNTTMTQLSTDMPTSMSNTTLMPTTSFNTTSMPTSSSNMTSTASTIAPVPTNVKCLEKMPKKCDADLQKDKASLIDLLTCKKALGSLLKNPLPRKVDKCLKLQTGVKGAVIVQCLKDAVLCSSQTPSGSSTSVTASSTSMTSTSSDRTSMSSTSMTSTSSETSSVSSTSMPSTSTGTTYSIGTTSMPSTTGSSTVASSTTESTTPREADQTMTYVTSMVSNGSTIAVTETQGLYTTVEHSVGLVNGTGNAVTTIPITHTQVVVYSETIQTIISHLVTTSTDANGTAVTATSAVTRTSAYTMEAPVSSSPPSNQSAEELDDSANPNKVPFSTYLDHLQDKNGTGALTEYQKQQIKDEVDTLTRDLPLGAIITDPGKAGSCIPTKGNPCIDVRKAGGSKEMQDLADSILEHRGVSREEMMEKIKREQPELLEQPEDGKDGDDGDHGEPGKDDEDKEKKKKHCGHLDLHCSTGAIVGLALGLTEGVGLVTAAGIIAYTEMTKSAIRAAVPMPLVQGASPVLWPESILRGLHPGIGPSIAQLKYGMGPGIPQFPDVPPAVLPDVPSLDLANVELPPPPPSPPGEPVLPVPEVPIDGDVIWPRPDGVRPFDSIAQEGFDMLSSSPGIQTPAEKAGWGNAPPPVEYQSSVDHLIQEEIKNQNTGLRSPHLEEWEVEAPKEDAAHEQMKRRHDEIDQIPEEELDNPSDEIRSQIDEIRSDIDELNFIREQNSAMSYVAQDNQDLSNQVTEMLGRSSDILRDHGGQVPDAPGPASAPPEMQDQEVTRLDWNEMDVTLQYDRYRMARRSFNDLRSYSAARAEDYDRFKSMLMPDKFPEKANGLRQDLLDQCEKSRNTCIKHRTRLEAQLAQCMSDRTRVPSCPATPLNTPVDPSHPSVPGSPNQGPSRSQEDLTEDWNAYKEGQDTDHTQRKLEMCEAKLKRAEDELKDCHENVYSENSSSSQALLDLQQAHMERDLLEAKWSKADHDLQMCNELLNGRNSLDAPAPKTPSEPSNPDDDDSDPSDSDDDGDSPAHAAFKAWLVQVSETVRIKIGSTAVLPNGDPSSTEQTYVDRPDESEMSVEQLQAGLEALIKQLGDIRAPVTCEPEKLALLEERRTACLATKSTQTDPDDTKAPPSTKDQGVQTEPQACSDWKMLESHCRNSRSSSYHTAPENQEEANDICENEPELASELKEAKEDLDAKTEAASRAITVDSMWAVEDATDKVDAIQEQCSLQSAASGSCFPETKQEMQTACSACGTLQNLDAANKSLRKAELKQKCSLCVELRDKCQIAEKQMALLQDRLDRCEQENSLLRPALKRAASRDTLPSSTPDDAAPAPPSDKPRKGSTRGKAGLVDQMRQRFNEASKNDLAFKERVTSHSRLEGEQKEVSETAQLLNSKLEHEVELLGMFKDMNDAELKQVTEEVDNFGHGTDVTNNPLTPAPDRVTYKSKVAEKVARIQLSGTLAEAVERVKDAKNQLLYHLSPSVRVQAKIVNNKEDLVKLNEELEDKCTKAAHKNEGKAPEICGQFLEPVQELLKGAIDAELGEGMKGLEAPQADFKPWGGERMELKEDPKKKEEDEKKKEEEDKKKQEGEEKTKNPWE